MKKSKGCKNERIHSCFKSDAVQILCGRQKTVIAVIFINQQVLEIQYIHRIKISQIKSITLENVSPYKWFMFNMTAPTEQSSGSLKAYDIRYYIQHAEQCIIYNIQYKVLYVTYNTR